MSHQWTVYLLGARGVRRLGGKPFLSVMCLPIGNSWEGGEELAHGDGPVDERVEPGSRDGCVSLMNLSLCGSIARSSVGPSGVSMTITMTFVYARQCPIIRYQ